MAVSGKARGAKTGSNSNYYLADSKCSPAPTTTIGSTRSADLQEKRRNRRRGTHRGAKEVGSSSTAPNRNTKHVASSGIHQGDIPIKYPLSRGHISCMPMPTTSSFQHLKNDGCGTVVSLITDKEDRKQLADEVRNLGMDSFTINCYVVGNRSQVNGMISYAQLMQPFSALGQDSMLQYTANLEYIVLAPSPTPYSGLWESRNGTSTMYCLCVARWAHTGKNSLKRPCIKC